MTTEATALPLTIETDDPRRDTAKRILDEAERLFRHYGFTKTTVGDIARELGMSPANIYRFFASKSAIHEALVERMLVQYEVMLQEISARPISAADRLRIAVLAHYDATIAQMMDETKVHEMVLVALDEHWSTIDRHLKRMAQIMTRIIAEGIAAGEFAEQDPALAARCFRASVISLCHPTVVAQCRVDRDVANAADLIEFALRALKA